MEAFGAYQHDPDQNGVELYWNRPRHVWPRAADGWLAMHTRPLGLAGLPATDGRNAETTTYQDAGPPYVTNFRDISSMFAQLPASFIVSCSSWLLMSKTDFTPC